jgi:hypothetical protein
VDNNCALITRLLLDTFKCIVSVSTKYVKSQSQSYITTEGQSANLYWYQAPSGAHDKIFIIVRQLRICWCGALSLTRGRVCRLQLLLALASAFSGPSPAGFVTIFYCLRFETPQTGSPGPRIYIPQEQGGSVITPGHWVPFSSPPTIRKSTVEVFESASTRGF